VGSNTIKTAVTAFDGNGKTYTITVTGQQARLALQIGNLSLSEVENMTDSLQNDRIVNYTRGSHQMAMASMIFC